VYAGRSDLTFKNEGEMIARLRRGDLEALGELYRELGPVMVSLARSLLRDRAEADDVVADSLIRVHDKAAGFRGERGLRTWVLRIVANRCRDLLRRRRFDAGEPESHDPLAHAGLRVEPLEEWDHALDQEKALAALEGAIGRLPREQREAVILRDRLGLSQEEVAATLGIRVGAVKSRLFRARETLKVELKKLLGE
jgi:RNA polymerase sigma-70 factor (ECF subfamily)